MQTYNQQTQASKSIIKYNTITNKILKRGSKQQTQDNTNKQTNSKHK